MVFTHIRPLNSISFLISSLILLYTDLGTIVSRTQRQWSLQYIQSLYGGKYELNDPREHLGYFMNNLHQSL